MKTFLKIGLWLVWLVLIPVSAFVGVLVTTVLCYEECTESESKPWALILPAIVISIPILYRVYSRYTKNKT